MKDIEKILILCLGNYAYDELFWAFYITITSIQRMDVTKKWIDRHPPPVYRLLKTQPLAEDRFVPPYLANLKLMIIRNLVKSASQAGIASLAVLEEIAVSVARISIGEHLHLLMLALLSVRSSELVQGVRKIAHLAVTRGLGHAHCSLEY